MFTRAFKTGSLKGINEPGEMKKGDWHRCDTRSKVLILTLTKDPNSYNKSLKQKSNSDSLGL
jgi:hypothetical protein